MKKHILFIFISLFALQSGGQTSKLITNNSNFLNSFQTGCLISYQPCVGSCSPTYKNPTGTPLLTLDGICNNYSGVYVNSSTYYGAYRPDDWIIYDLQSIRFLNNIILRRCSNSFGGNGSLHIQIQTATSALGPWTIVKDSTIITVPNVSTSFPCSNTTGDFPFTINKSSRYWKIYFVSVPIYTTNVFCSTGQCNWTHNYSSFNFGEINFYELPFINDNGTTIIQDNQCVTLTAAASGETYLWSTGESAQSINVCNSGTYTVNVTNTSFTGNQDHSASISVSKLGSQDNLPGPNGEVYAIYKNGNNVYVGGDFNAFGPITGSGAQIDTSTANANTALPRVDGTINTAISDGNGGWYIGGVFTRVGSYVINNLAHIKPDNTINLNFKPEPNGAVNTLALYGSSLYAGGTFTTVKTIANNYASKIDASTGDPYLWNANANGIVRSIQLYADQIIFGGNFTSLGGANRNYLGAVDTVYIQATTWNPNANAAVYKVYVNGNKLYAGGDFTTIGGVSKQYGCGFTLPAFTTDGYNMGANGRINDFVLNGTILYAAGSFTTIGGANRNYIAAMNYLNALTNSFNATADGVVNTLAIAGGNLIAGGAFSNIGGATRNRLAALSLTTGTAAGWNPNVVGLKGTTSIVSCLATQGTNIYAGGSFYSVGASVRNNLTCIDATTGQLTSWNPNVNNIVRAIWADNNYVYLGGDFSTVNGSITKNRIAQLSATTAVATGWNPNADNSVYALTVKGTTLFVGGSFANIGGAARAKIAALSTTSGAATAFNPTVNGNVNALCIGGDSLYIGGAFTTIGGQTRNRLASYNITASSLTALNPNVDNTVNALSFSNNKLYIGGSFANVSSTARVNMAEFDVLTNSLTSLNTDAITTSGVNALFSKDSSLYLGGGFNFPNQGNPINNLGSINTSGAYVGYWQPQPDNIIRTIFASDNKVYVGGSFKNITSRYQPYFASTDIFINAPMLTITNITPTSLCANNPVIITGNNFTSITSVKIGGNNITYTVLSSDTIIITPGSTMSGTISITNPLGTVLSTQSVTVNPGPSAPTVGTITQPSCTVTTGIVVINGLPATGSWTINPGNISGSGTSKTITGLATGTYNYTVTNASSCTSLASANVVINAQPSTPSAPTVGTITQPSCAVATGSVVLNGLPATGSWIINPGNISGTGTSKTLTGLIAGTYNYTVSNASNCTSATSANVVINTQPTTPSAPTIGTITQPSCAVATGSVVLNGLPATGSWTINPGNISGTGTSKTLTGLAPGTYNYTVTNASTCTSVASANIVINSSPSAPSTPTVGTITQPSCAVATGSVIINGLPATGSWIINPGNISGTGISTTISNIAAGTYNYTVTNASGCTSTASANVIINTQPVTPTVPTVGTITQTTCASSTGSVILNGLPATGTWTINPGNISGTGISKTISNIAAGTYNYTVTNASGCTSIASANVIINTQPVTPTVPTVGTITQTTCASSTGSVILNGLPATGTWIINPGNISGTGISKTISNIAAGTYNYTVTNTSSCTSSASANVVINTQPITPTAPIVGVITQPTCTTAGSVVLNGLPATGSWTLNPGNITGTGTSKTITGLNAGTYNYTVTNASNCTSVASSNVVINTQPTTPTAPTVGTIIQPTCALATGSVVLNGLPATGSWTLNPGNISGSGTTATISNLATGTYNYTVTNASACTSVASANVVINSQPVTPTAPAVGTITQPSCVVATGSVVLNGLPATGSWTINPGNITGTGTSKAITGLIAGTYNYIVTNASACTSIASANVVINTQPTTPTAPTIGTITQPSCAVAIGSVVLNGLPATGSWTINPGNISGSGTSTTISNLTAATYNYTVTNASACTSVASANVVINSQPVTPTAPAVGIITQPSCTVATGSVVLNGLPATGSWTINPGNISGSGTSTTISNLTAATYNYTVTNASACTSVASTNVVINSQPVTPTAPAVGIITQPSCTVATGSVVLNGLPATGSWTINPGNITGTGTSKTITGLITGTYNYTVTNASACTSVASANVVINTQPATPPTPIITQNGNTLFSNSTIGNQWYNLTNGIISNATATTYLPQQIGDYFSIVTISGCSSDTSNIIHYDNTGIDVINNNETLIVYPNPFKNELIIEMEGNKDILDFEILNSIGQQIFKGKIKDKTVIQTANFVPGVYLIKIKNGKNYLLKKIIKE